MTVQANAAPLGLAWQNTACGSCTRRRTTLPEPKERSKLFCRKSCAEAKELCPADHSLATCTVTTTARKGRWLAISRLPVAPHVRAPDVLAVPGRPGPVPKRSPWTSPPSRISPRRPRHPPPSRGPSPRDVPPFHAVRRSSPRRPCRLGAVPGRPQDVPTIPGHPAGRPPDVPSSQAVPGCRADPASPAIIRPLSHWRVAAALTGALP
jgi:hypothetical protein